LYKKTTGLRIKPLIEGDINADGRVDHQDLEILATAYGSTPTEPNWNISADINGNKIVEVQDLFVIGTNYGKP
jgi:Dockerin type I domain